MLYFDINNEKSCKITVRDRAACS